MKRVFKRHHRLLKAEHFSRVFRHGHKHHFQSLIIYTCLNKLDHARLGFALSKKRIRSAVQRNRVKRVIRECFRQHCAELAAVDFVVIAVPDTAKRSNGELKQHFSACLQQQCKDS